nr:DUF4214 domain-containing protein [uncultured Campylobacter sp.]
MALTTTQVNAAFVALLGRAAEGNANAWAANSADTTTLANAILSVDGKYKNSLEQAKTNEDFVEALYQQVLGRNSDADGKAFWLNALANGTSRDELKANFLAAAKAEDPNLTAFYTSNQQFLENIYSALLNRGVDSSGLEHWMNLLNNGTSRAEVVASIIDAINANKDSDDYAIYNAKMSVADAVTAAFAGPKAGLNEEQNDALNQKLIGINNLVTSTDVTQEIIKAEIEQVVGSYGKEAAPLTFKAVTDKLENYELGNADSATAQTFRGNINLQDATKSTINDKATLNTSKFSDTLVVDVIPSTAGAAFDYTGNAKQVKTFAGLEGIKSLTINNGTANITNLDNTGITENLKITGAANVSGSVSEALNYLEINTGGNANATATITVNANLKEYVGKGSGKDNITVSGADTTVTVDTINTGAGNDTLIVSGNGTVANVDLGAGNDELIVSGANASITGTINLGTGEDDLTVSGGSIANAKINLGANNDVITITSVKENGLAGATIDGGAGRDTLIVSGDISDKGAFKLSNVEVLEASGAGVKVSYSQIKDQALTLTKSGGADKLEINAANETAINLNLNNKAASGETALDKLDLIDVGSGANSGVTVTLNKDDGISETINLAAGASGDKAVKITGLATGDILTGGALNGDITSPFVKFAKAAAGPTGLQDKAAYYIDADGSTAEKALAALGAVTLADQSKALVAFNTDNGTYIYSVSGAAGNLTATNFTLAAIVDDKINNKDEVKRGAITFTADNTPKELKDVSVEFDSLGGEHKLTLDDPAYSDAKAIIVTGVSGNTLSVSGANAQIETVNAFITANNGQVKKEDGVTSTVNVYLGSGGSQELNFNTGNVNNNAIASGADTLSVNTTGLITLKDASSFGGTLKLNLDDAIASNIAISGAVSTTTDLNNLFVNANASDKIAFTIASNAQAGQTFTGTKAAETITLNANQEQAVTLKLGANDGAVDTVVYGLASIANAKVNVIEEFEKANDKIDLKALSLGNNLTDETVSSAAATAFTGSKVYNVGAISKAAASIAFADVFAAQKPFKTTGASESAKGLVVAKGNDDKYAIFAVVNGNDTSITEGEVKLIATVDAEVAASNFIFA